MEQGRRGKERQFRQPARTQRLAAEQTRRRPVVSSLEIHEDGAVTGSNLPPGGRSQPPAAPGDVDREAPILDIPIDDLNDELPAWTEDPSAPKEPVPAEAHRQPPPRPPPSVPGASDPSGPTPAPSAAPAPAAQTGPDPFDAALADSLQQLDDHLWMDFADPSKISQTMSDSAAAESELPHFPDAPALASFPGAETLPYRMTPPPPVPSPPPAPEAAPGSRQPANALEGLGDADSPPARAIPDAAMSADIPVASVDLLEPPAPQPPVAPPPPPDSRPPRGNRIRPEHQLPKKWERHRLEKPAPSRTVIGIDLGTTNCCAAVVQNGDAFVLAARDGGSTTPSAVCFAQDGTVYVGEDAARRASSDPLNTIVGSKRMIGRPFHSPIVQSIRTHFAYPIVRGEEGEAAVDISQEVVSLEEVAAYLLNDIREAASLQLGESITRAVITCPAFYNERQREAVRVAGELAGLNVERVLSEPTAAALNYGIGQTMQTRRVAVYDLGGGTFDVSLLEVDGNVYEVLATGGDTFLGGIDFDASIAGLIVESILEQGGPDPRRDAAAVACVMQHAEKAKKALTERPATIVHIRDLTVFGRDARELSIPVRREDADRRMASLLEQTEAITRSVCERAGVRPEQVDDVLLVGGQTRYPAVRDMVGRIFKKAPRASVHPEEAVALGAAQYAAGMETVDNVVLLDALPMSIGLALSGGHYYRLIERDSRLPAEGACLLPTAADGQTEMEVAFFQGDAARVEHNEPLGSLTVRGLPPAALGSVTVEVRARVNEESVLEVVASEPSTGQTFETKFATRSTPEKWRKALGVGGLPADPPRGSDGAAPSLPSSDLEAIEGGPKRVWRWLTGFFRSR